MTKRAVFCILAGVLLATAYSFSGDRLEFDNPIPTLLMGAASAWGIFLVGPEAVRGTKYLSISLVFALIIFEFYNNGLVAGGLTLLWAGAYLGCVFASLRTLA
jgi:hypothetical protein